MNTRHASDNSPFRQERYMSSPELLRGLLATCVAARGQTLSEPLHRKLVWWLQKQSWEPGWLDKLAAEIMERWPARFVTAAVQRLGVEPGRIYSSGEVREARNSMHVGKFMLRGERGDMFWLQPDWWEANLRDGERQRRRDAKAKELRESRGWPNTYPASAFTEACMDEAREKLGKFLFEKLCLNPAIELNDRTLWYFPALVETLAELHDIRAAEAASRAPVTRIGAQVHESLDYALAVRGLVVIDGVARTGKTFAVKAWCDAHSGQARYVQVPSSNDDMSFYRALCEALGLGANLAYKALELRARIEAVLQTGDLLLVLDEGHYLKIIQG